MHERLFIPGPVEVDPEVLKQMARPQIGHRGKDFERLFSDVTAKLRKLMRTDGDVFIFTCSGTGLWEAVARNCVGKALCCVNGAFSEKWHEVILACGKDADKLEFDWGNAVDPSSLRKTLEKGGYDAVTIVHNETSTGVESPLEDIAKVMEDFPDVAFCVDAVSSLGGVGIDVDRLGIDVCLASVQKAIGLPPGISICSVSSKAIERSRGMKGKGYYLDFITMQRYAQKLQTPTTPSIPHMYALDFQLSRILQEGDARSRRHEEMAEMTRRWARRNGFELFSEPGAESRTVTCIRNTRDISVKGLNEALAGKARISDGYGCLKQKTFRIGHMGDMRKEELSSLLHDIEVILQ